MTLLEERMEAEYRMDEDKVRKGLEEQESEENEKCGKHGIGEKQAKERCEAGIPKEEDPEEVELEQKLEEKENEQEKELKQEVEQEGVCAGR